MSSNLVSLDGVMKFQCARCKCAYTTKDKYERLCMTCRVAVARNRNRWGATSLGVQYDATGRGATAQEDDL